jgi:hypothetical protein
VRSTRPLRSRPVVALAAVFVAAIAFLGGAAAERSLGASPRADDAPDRRAAPADSAPRVVIDGDSLVVQAEPYVGAVGRSLGVEVTPRAHGGLAPCDGLPWLAEDLASSPPDVVVFAFSGNSLSDCMRLDDGTLASGDELVGRYREDIESAIRMATGAGSSFILASPPASQRAPDVWQRIDALYRDVAAQHAPYAQYTDAGLDISPGGRFVPEQRCLPFELSFAPAGEACGSDRSISVRAGDGVHFCGDVVEGTPGTCQTYSSGALRYAIALVTAAKVNLDYLSSLDDIAPQAVG